MLADLTVLSFTVGCLRCHSWRKVPDIISKPKKSAKEFRIASGAGAHLYGDALTEATATASVA